VKDNIISGCCIPVFSSILFTDVCGRRGGRS